jgi:WD40 repeat protein
MDGGIMATLGTGDLVLWDLKLGLEVRRVPLHGWKATRGGFLISANLKTIVKGATDGELRIWQPADGGGSRTIQLDQPRSTVDITAISPNGDTVALASWYNSTIQVWDVVTGKEKCPHPRHLGGVRSVAFASDDNTIVSAGEDCTLRIWDVPTGRQVRLILDGPQRLWEVPAENAEREEQLSQFGPTGRISLSPDGRTVVSAGMDGTIRQWDLATGKEVRSIKLEQAGRIRTIQCAPDRTVVAVGSEDGNTLGIWDMVTGKAIRRVSALPGKLLDVAFAPNGKTIASTDDGGSVKLWEASTLRLLSRSTASQSFLMCVAFSPNGETICAGGGDEAILFQNVKTGHVRHARRRDAGGKTTLSVAFSADNKLACSSGDDGVVRIWNANSAEEVAQLHGDPWSVEQVAFSHDSRLLASANSDGTILLWDVSRAPLIPKVPKRN